MDGRRRYGLITDRAGSLATMTALMMPVMIGAAGLASDTAQWTLMRRAMQRQADSAALAGAYALSQSKAVTSTVTTDLAKNSNFQLSTTVIENAPTSGPYAGNTSAVRVQLAGTARLPFTSFIMGSGVAINVEATAGLVQDGDFCILALDNSSTVGITNTGNTTIDAKCGMHSNSTGDPAVSGQGSASITASPVSAVGNVYGTSQFKSGTVFLPYNIVQRDPYAYLPTPSISPGGSSVSVQPNKSATLNPGTYTSMDLKGTVTLNPDTYYIDGGYLSLGSQANVTGTGVTFVFTKSGLASNGNSSAIASLTMNGGATVNLTAPSSGTFKGVLMYQDRRATPLSGLIKINGNSSSKIQGALYFPQNELQFNGTTGMNINCLQMVAYRFTFTGNSSITNVCPANEGSSTFKGTSVRLMA